MNIQKCQPLEARRVYKLRPYKNFGAGGGVFAVLFICLIFFINPLIAVLIAGVMGFGVYYYLESRLLVITCPRCGKDINTNTPWECGFQGCQNLNVDEFPFVHECEKCHFIPKAYICHHCGKTISFTTDPQQLHAAKRLENLELPVKVVIKDLAKDKASKQKDEIGDLEHELGVTTLKKKIEIVKNMPADAPVVKTPLETAMEEIESYANRGMTDLEAETLLMAKADVDFANDEHKRAQKHALLRDAVRERMK
jgi:hypothetical protein